MFSGPTRLVTRQHAERVGPCWTFEDLPRPPGFSACRETASATTGKAELSSVLCSDKLSRLITENAEMITHEINSFSANAFMSQRKVNTWRWT